MSESDVGKAAVKRFASLCKTRAPKYEIVDKAGEHFLAIEVGESNDIYLQAIKRLKSEKDIVAAFGDRVFLRPRRPASWLNSLESQMLQGVIAESLTVGRSTLKHDFFKNFIPFSGGRRATNL